MLIELCVMQFWSEIICVNQTHATRSSEFRMTHVISDQIHSTWFKYHYYY